jgi:nitrite reductase/ring-hydroxylating ferredoxin subunit
MSENTSRRYPVAQMDELPDGGRKIVTVPYRGKQVEIGVFRLGEEYFAYRNVCPHAGAPVCQGRLCGTTLPSKVYEYDYSEEKKVLRCPWHGWEFDLRTGKQLVDEKMKLRSYAVAAGKNENLEAFPLEADEEMLYVLL